VNIYCNACKDEIKSNRNGFERRENAASTHFSYYQIIEISNVMGITIIFAKRKRNQMNK